MRTNNSELSIQSVQIEDSDKLINLLGDFWKSYKETRKTLKVTPGILHTLPDVITKDEFPANSSSIEDVLKEFQKEILPFCVNTSNPLFLGYVTPPALDITWIGNAITAMLNQNVSFSALSPAGTAIEQYVINQLCSIVGYYKESGGIIVSGGSAANLQALITARRSVLKENVALKGNSASLGEQRIYCSTEIHRSIHKAAIIMGIGVQNVVEVPTDKNHKINISKLKKLIDEDKTNGKVPIAVVGAAGTRACGSFDNLKELYDVAKDYQIWFHVDGAYGAFLKLAANGPKELDYLHLADSITLDPHKLLFMPFDSGCLLVRENQKLVDAFGTEGEYLDKYHPVGEDYCDYGIQLGRSMKSLNVWLALKYLGINLYRREFERLLNLAKDFRNILHKDDEFELVGPSESIVVCFRWKKESPYIKDEDINTRNDKIRIKLVEEGISFLNGVVINKKTCLRACFSNFNTTIDDLKRLLAQIKTLANK